MTDRIKLDYTPFSWAEGNTYIPSHWELEMLLQEAFDRISELEQEVKRLKVEIL